MPDQNKAVKIIGERLVAHGADERLVRGIVGDRRLQWFEKALLLQDIAVLMQTKTTTGMCS